jgi:DNA-binding response OmpR family regulator
VRAVGILGGADAPRRLEALLDQEAPVEDGAAPVGDARRLDAADRLSRLVLVDAGVLRLAGPDQARLFDAVAPGVPVVLAVDAGARVEERVAFELKGFHVVSRPFALPDLLAKVERPTKVAPARDGARAQVEALCG